MISIDFIVRNKLKQSDVCKEINFINYINVYLKKISLSLAWNDRHSTWGVFVSYGSHFWWMNWWWKVEVKDGSRLQMWHPWTKSLCLLAALTDDLSTPEDEDVQRHPYQCGWNLVCLLAWSCCHAEVEYKWFCQKIFHNNKQCYIAANNDIYNVKSNSAYHEIEILVGLVVLVSFHTICNSCHLAGFGRLTG